MLIDANLLVYAYVRGFAQHEAARDWVDRQLGGRRRVALPWESLLAFIRLVTNPRVFAEPAPVRAAWGQVTAWLNAAPVWVPAPTDRHRELLGELIPPVSRPSLIADAHLAALAIEHGLVLASADADFARFAHLRWVNPLRQG